jgi:hypothetical protein
VGHANIYTTLNTYTRVMNDSLSAAAEKIGAEWLGIVQSEGKVSSLIH